MSHIRLKTEYTVEGSYGSRDKAVLYADRNCSCDITTFFYEDGTPICSFEDTEHPNLLDAMNELNTGMPETNHKIQWAQIPEYVDPPKKPLTDLAIRIHKWKPRNNNGMRFWYDGDEKWFNNTIPESPEGRYWGFELIHDPKMGTIKIGAKTNNGEQEYETFFNGYCEDMTALGRIMQMLNIK